ncbi:MAG: sulfotransferase [Flavobacteriales bacterium]
MIPSGEQKGGSLFLVGPPRSGTKLLQSILNASPQVSIGPESHIFSRLLLEYGDVSLEGYRQELYWTLAHSHFWERLRRNGFPKELHSLLGPVDNVPDLIHLFFQEIALWKEKYYAAWIGDKTPNYIRWTPLFRKYFPDARFIMIVRDPRDQALSVRNTWGKDPLLAAERWKRDLSILHEASQHAPDRYFYLRYEDLLEDPEGSLGRLSEYLNISFDEAMLEASAPEKFGSGKDVKGVLHENHRKYQKGFRPERIRRIEEITLPLIKEWGYPVHYAKSSGSIGPVYRGVAKGMDFLQNVRFNLKHRGIIRGSRYLIRIRRDKA